MTEKLSDTALATRRKYTDGLRNPPPEFLAWLDALTDEDIAAQIAADPAMAPELDDEWFRRAHQVSGWLVGSEPAEADARHAVFKDAAE